MGVLGWQAHRWRQRNSLQLRIGAGTSVTHRQYVKCGRDFLVDPVSARSHAVFVSGISFHLLDAAVPAKWVTESCPGEHLPNDDEDRKKSIAELFVSDEPERSRTKLG